MVASPGIGRADPTQALQQQINDLKTQIVNLANKTLYSASIGAGGLTVQAGGTINLPLGGTIRDANGNIIFSADQHNGQRLSTPFLAIPMWPRWCPGAAGGPGFQSSTSVGDWTMAASACTSEVTLWEGRIPQVLHPQIAAVGAFGRASGTTSVPTYRLYVVGSLVATWSQTGYGGGSSGQANITAVTGFGSENVQVTLTMQANVSSSDQLACSAAVYMCGQ